MRSVGSWLAVHVQSVDRLAFFRSKTSVETAKKSTLRTCTASMVINLCYQLSMRDGAQAGSQQHYPQKEEGQGHSSQTRLPGFDIRHDLIENAHQLPSHWSLSQHRSSKQNHTFLLVYTSPVPRSRCKKTSRTRSSQRFSRLHRLIAKPSGEKSHGCSEYFSGAPSLLP